MDRRTFLGAAGLALALGGVSAAPAWATPRCTGDPFALGVASGDPQPDGVVLWTRLAPDPLAADGSGGMPAGTVEVGWEVARDEGFAQVVRRGTAFAEPERGHSVPVEVGGLRPAATYVYRFRAGATPRTGPWRRRTSTSSCTWGTTPTRTPTPSRSPNSG